MSTSVNEVLLMVQKLQIEFELKFARQEGVLKHLENEMTALKNSINEQSLEVTKEAIKELVKEARAEISQCCKQLITDNAKQVKLFFS